MHVPLDPKHRTIPDWDRMTPEEQVRHYRAVKRHYVPGWPEDPTLDVEPDHPQRVEIDEVLLLNTPPAFRERMSS